MILTCTFPDLWKTAIVTPVQKSKQNNSLSNFRPISVLPVASKILERLVFDAMVGHLLKYKLLSTEQSGFRPGHSTQDVLLCVTDSWLKAIDDGKYVGAVFLDLAKAFDCVDHEILLKKLTCYGVRGDALKWMQSFLYGRFQRVSLHGTLSAKGEVKVGVPQGSILGPLLFSIYVNDLPTAITDVDVNLYADDTELHYCHSDFRQLECILQCAVTQLFIWLVANKLKLSVPKSSSMLIGTRQRISGKTLHLSLDSLPLQQVSTVRYLGVYIDQHLTWHQHVEYVLRRVRGKLYSINRLKPLTPTVLKLLYQAHVLPIIDYCDVVWVPINVGHLKRLERLHSRFSSYDSARSSAFNLTLVERRRFHIAIQVYKILKRLSPSYLLSTFRSALSITGRAGRNVHRLYVPAVRLNYGKRSLYYRGTTIWNSLPTSITEMNSLNSFKLAYLSHI